jgi:heme exporter protein B
LSVVRRAWAITAKDAAQELRRRVALASVFFFAATALALVSYAIGPFGLRAEDRAPVQAALFWIILFFSAATGLPRAFVREEETGTALALRRVTSGALVLAGKTLFNYGLFLAIAAVAIPGFAILLEWTVAAPVQLAVIVMLAGWGLAAVSTFLSALVAQAGQKNVLFVVISFPMLLPLLLFAISGTLAATRGEAATTAIEVIVSYDGAATCVAYLLAEAAWEE